MTHEETIKRHRSSGLNSKADLVRELEQVITGDGQIKKGAQLREIVARLGKAVPALWTDATN